MFASKSPSLRLKVPSLTTIIDNVLLSFTIISTYFIIIHHISLYFIILHPYLSTQFLMTSIIHQPSTIIVIHHHDPDATMISPPCTITSHHWQSVNHIDPATNHHQPTITPPCTSWGCSGFPQPWTCATEGRPQGQLRRWNVASERGDAWTHGSVRVAIATVDEWWNDDDYGLWWFLDIGNPKNGWFISNNGWYWMILGAPYFVLVGSMWRIFFMIFLLNNGWLIEFDG